jgi:hypothetical protein
MNLKEMLQSVVQRRSKIPVTQISKRKLHHKGRTRSSTFNRRKNQFHLSVDGIDQGVQVVDSYMTRSEAKTHFNKMHPGKYVRVSTRE